MLLLYRAALGAVGVLRRDDDDNDDGSDNSNCVHATPGPNGNVPITACNSYYNYDPQFAPAVAVATLFAIFTAIHVFEGVFFKKRYTWVLIMGVLWETIAFIIHSLGTKDQQQVGYSTAWNILFLLAPLWINAFAYMTFARMVLYWHPEGKVAGLRAGVIARWFVLADIISFVVQGAGGIMASPTASPDIIQTGLDVFMGGIGLQLFFIFVFLGLMAAFQVRCTRATPVGDSVWRPSWKPPLFALYGVLICIGVRIIFRLAEFARGLTPENPLPFHEQYAYALDCFPMMVALLLLAIYHPGRYLLGPESEFPHLTRKEKKVLKQEKKAARLADKDAKKRAKLDMGMGARHGQNESDCQLQEILISGAEEGHRR